VSFKQLWIALLQERNKLNPIACLPSKILDSILGYGGLQTALVASSVCRRWRSAALNNPTLWTTMDMRRQWYSKDLIQMQLTRSAALPLQLHFDLMHDAHTMFNINVPDSLTSFIHRAGAISGVLSSTIFRADLPPIPQLRSLQVILDNQKKRGVPFPQLVHLSVNFVGLNLSTCVPLPKNLLTLHLINISESISTLLQVLETLPQLEEFALDGLEPTIKPPSKPSKSNKKLHPLRRLFLKHVSLPVVMYLIESTPLRSPVTHVHIEPFDQTLPPSFSSPVTSISINVSTCTVGFHHGNASTKLIFTPGAWSQGNMAMLTAAELSSVDSLFWTGGDPLTSSQVKTFKNLQRLEFVFFPFVSASSPDMLAAILNAELAIYCPQLRHLGIILRHHQANVDRTGRDRSSSTSSKPTMDQSVHVLLDFLESWLEFNHQPFPHLAIRDETGPSSYWKAYHGTIEAQVGHFQLGMVIGDWGYGHFPEMRSFHRNQ
jgi:hypothetical protein